MTRITTSENPGAAPADTTALNAGAWAILDVEPLGRLLLDVEEGIEGGDVADAVGRSAEDWRHDPDWHSDFVRALLQLAGADSLDGLGPRGPRLAVEAAAAMLRAHAEHVLECARDLEAEATREPR